eukprot:jgi/Phyca11/124533/e_gw1.54.209.1
MARSNGQQQGRTRTTGQGKAPKQFKRVAISYGHKLDRPLDTEPDWTAFNRLLEQVPVVRHTVDPSRDIDTFPLEDSEQ